MLLLEVLGVGCCRGDGVSDGLKMDLAVDGGDVSEALQDVFLCVGKTQ